VQTLGDIIRKGARHCGNKECLVFEGTHLTYAQVDKRVNRLANYLLSVDFSGYKHVAILAENCHQFVEIYFGSAKAGCVSIPLNFRLSRRELATILKDAEAKILFFGKGYADTAKEVACDAGIKQLISIEGDEKGCLSYESLLSNSSGTDPNLFIDENQLAILMYTGGTTGRPKGVMLSHRNIITAMIDLTMTYRFSTHDITCFMLPMFHAAIWPVFCLFIARGKVVILRRAELDKIMQLIQDEKCTHINAVPTIYNWLMEHPDLNKYDLTSLKIVSYAGSPISPVLLKKIMDKFGDVSFFQGYGLTEAAPAMCTLLPEDHVVEGSPEQVRHLNSVGQETYMVTVKVVREDGCDAEPEEIGEIVGKGKNIMLGYWKMPEKTAETIKDGWLHTGDIGVMDKKGYVYLMDRKNDMIITGGENVYPSEVENILLEYPAVMEVAVIGVPDERWGESVKAVVVLKKGESATAAEIIEYTKSRLTGYKCPKSVDFKDVLPKTAAGKISRSMIKSGYWQGKNRLIS
jgi:long-chain acyl-CoA synthetase